MDAWIIRVACAGMVCFSSVLMVMGLGLHFCLSSFKSRVICILGKSFVPYAVSRIAECFPEEYQDDDWVGCFGHDDEGLFERVVPVFELHCVCCSSFFKFGVGILYLELGRRCLRNYGCIGFSLYFVCVSFADDVDVGSRID